MKHFILLLSLSLITACNKNEAEYYGYTKKAEDSQVKKIEFSDSEMISNAIQNDDWVALQLMLEQGLSLNRILDSGRTLLNESVLWDQETIFKNLILRGADPKTKDQTGVDTYDMCADKINFRVLLEPGLLKNFQNELFGYLENDDTDELKRMLEQKINPNFILPSGETPLTYAVANNLENCIRAMLNTQFKTDVHMKDQSGNTGLALAQNLKLKRIEKLLIGRGAQY